MEVGDELIGIVKTNTKGLCKDTIENLTKDWPGGPYLVLSNNLIVPVGRPIIYIGYNYNSQKVIYFIVTDNTGITQTGITYLSKYSDQFTNIYICPVSSPLVMYKFFGSVN